MLVNRTKASIKLIDNMLGRAHNYSLFQCKYVLKYNKECKFCIMEIKFLKKEMYIQ